MSDEIFYDRTDGYGLILDEYNGKFKLIAGRQKEDKVYKDWVYLSKWNKDIGGPEPDDKKRPMGAYLGSKEDAIKALRFFLKELGDTGEDNVPF